MIKFILLLGVISFVSVHCISEETCVRIPPHHNHICSPYVGPPIVPKNLRHERFQEFPYDWTDALCNEKGHIIQLRRELASQWEIDWAKAICKSLVKLFPPPTINIAKDLCYGEECWIRHNLRSDDEYT
ncbi:MAG: hypothetical protein Hyperionvirus35_4 [Hyperionvirus sp.]|uniref:Uncharacterized protein n=1 Tax=Hyperionvirus sp. TaxID=2487770 RepID=A0A3G5ABT6_9VIRU|nr:MAG: hypothetical protein Hyperionvirus35_4 [Hyperionvirus sp.]